VALYTISVFFATSYIFDIFQSIYINRFISGEDINITATTIGFEITRNVQDVTYFCGHWFFSFMYWPLVNLDQLEVALES
jgi:hypothetical protein